MLPESREKFVELLLYISSRCATDATFGSTKLNKVLYFADFLSYARWGQAITGVAYQHLPQGPAPKCLVPVRDELIRKGDLVLQPVPMWSGLVQQRPVNLREAELSLFSGREIALVDQIIDRLRGLTAEQTSDLSHSMIGWKSTHDGDVISYATIFLSDRSLDESEQQRALEIAAALKQDARLSVEARRLLQA